VFERRIFYFNKNFFLLRKNKILERQKTLIFYLIAAISLKIKIIKNPLFKHLA